MYLAGLVLVVAGCLALAVLAITGAVPAAGWILGAAIGFGGIGADARRAR